MAQERVAIKTPNGTCPARVFTPLNGGPAPAVIMYMDAFGIRPALFEMAQNLADEGFVVFLPDMYYRKGPYAPINAKQAMEDPAIRAKIGPLFLSLNNAMAADDAALFVAYLDTREDVGAKTLGVVGYCMGAGFALASAARLADRISAVVSLHGSFLANDELTSPHLLAPQLRAELYIGVAEGDHTYPPEMETRFRAALDAAGVTYRHENYGAPHGWTMPDFPIYSPQAAERAHREMVALFKRRLG
jgi:carboxymethylenebutenolidase